MLRTVVLEAHRIWCPVAIAVLDLHFDDTILLWVVISYQVQLSSINDIREGNAGVTHVTLLYVTLCARTVAIPTNSHCTSDAEIGWLLRRYELNTLTVVPPSALPRVGVMESKKGHVYPVWIQSTAAQFVWSVHVLEDWQKPLIGSALVRCTWTLNLSAFLPVSRIEGTSGAIWLRTVYKQVSRRRLEMTCGDSSYQTFWKPGVVRCQKGRTCWSQIWNQSPTFR